MSVERNASPENRIGVPALFFGLCLLALLVSLFGLFRTSGITETRVNDLQISWQTLVQDGIKGSEVVATDRLMQSVTRPVPAVHSAAAWSLAMGLLSLVLAGWVFVAVRSELRTRISSENQQARNEQAATAKLLDEMAPLASGDLDVRATATFGTPGALADAFNHAVSELQRLAGIQLSTSRKLGESVNRSQEFASAIEQHCSQQTGHIHESSNFLLSMSSSNGVLSEDAADASIATQSVIEKADSVSKALRESSQHLDSMRRDSDMSIQLMHSLKHYLHPIEDAIDVLKDLASNADLLAVNTTIRASSTASDEASQDVNRLSEEVARLAEALNGATRDISSLTRSMDADTSEAIACMQRLHSSCDLQHSEINSMADVLKQINEHTQVIHTHAVKMADEAVSHAGVVKHLSEKLNHMNQITDRTGQDARSNSASVETLKRLANDLRQSTSDFKLPDTNEVTVATQPPRSVARRAAERAAING
ncbi:MAG: methyl-accepting chemotaxis protein [Granulosicoccus sp.]